MALYALGEPTSTRLDAFNQRTAGKIIRLEAAAAHQVEMLPGFIHLVAPHEDVDHRVVGHKSGSQVNCLHAREELLCAGNHSLLGTALDECVERHLVHMEEIVFGIFEQEFHNLNGFLKLATLDAAIKKNVEKDFSALGSDLRPFHCLSCVVAKCRG